MTQQNAPSEPTIEPAQQTPVVGVEKKEVPGVLEIFFGIFTILVSAGLAVFGVMLGMGRFGDLSLIDPILRPVVICVSIAFTLYGLFSGATLAFAGGIAGKVLAIIFWIVLVAGGLCIGLLFALAIIGPEILGIF